MEVGAQLEKIEIKLCQGHHSRSLGISNLLVLELLRTSPSFNQCRDGRLVAVMVASMMKDKARLEDIFVDKARLEAMALASDS